MSTISTMKILNFFQCVKYSTYLLTLIGKFSAPSLGLMLTSYRARSVFCGSAQAMEREVSVRAVSSIDATPVGTEENMH